MTDNRRIENIVQLTDTIWQVNKDKILKDIEEWTGEPVPEACYKLIEFCVRRGCVLMEQTVGKNWRATA
jgi:hypothetical protein